MSANPVFASHQWTHDALSERVVFLSLAGDIDSFEWHCLDQEVQRRLAEVYEDRTQSMAPVSRFRPALIINTV